MTRIAEMHGISHNVGSSSAKVFEPSRFDYSRLTAGELNVALVRDMYRLYATVYDNANYAKAEAALTNALYEGVHDYNFTGAWFNTTLQAAAQTIAKAAKRVEPANGLFIEGRKNPSEHLGSDPIIDVDNLLLECEKYKTGGFFNGQTYQTSPDWAKYDACQRRVMNENFYKNLLNDSEKGLEKISHQMLYEFLPNDDPFANPNIGADAKRKFARHQQIMDDISRLSGLNKGNLRQWTNLGIMRATAAKTGQIMDAAQTIQYIIDNEVDIFDESQRDRIGFTGFEIAIIIIISAIALSGCVQTVMGKEPSAFGYIRDVASLSELNSPGTKDWRPPTDGGGGGSTVCPTGQQKNAQGLCVPIGDLPPCPKGQTRNAAGVCVPKSNTFNSNNKTLLYVGGAAVVGGAAWLLLK